MLELFCLPPRDAAARTKKSAGVMDDQRYDVDPSADPKDGKMHFASFVAAGEGAIPNDAMVQTPNVTANSKGQGWNSRMRWRGDAPQWNNNQEWAENGNRTGE